MQTNGHSKNYQVPKASHPWRNYANKKVDPDDDTPQNLPSLKKFLSDMIENWETYSVPSGDFGDGYAKIKSMPDNKAAEWLVNFVRKTWVGKNPGVYLDI